MPQEMNVLCCYSCKMYQVHIVKKARKWNCKVCNAKQSIQKIYFQGSGQDCRLHTQQLNAMKANNTFFIPSEQDNVSDASDCDKFANISHESDSEKPAENKWAKYLESTSETEDLENVEDSIFYQKTNKLAPGKKSSNTNINKDLLSLKKYLDDTDSESEDVNNKTKEFCFASLNHNSNIDDKCDMQDNTESNGDHNIDDKCDMQDNTESNGDHNNVANIFETYNELDDPLDL